MALSFQLNHKSSYDKFRSFVQTVVLSTAFDALIMLTIFINAFTIAIETYQEVVRQNGKLFEILDVIFICIYTFEFGLKILAEPRNYWNSNYNRFDFLILGISYFAFLQNVLGLNEVLDVTFLKVFR